MTQELFSLLSYVNSIVFENSFSISIFILTVLFASIFNMFLLSRGVLRSEIGRSFVTYSTLMYLFFVFILIVSMLGETFFIINEKREIILISLCFLGIFVFGALTVYFTPSRMTIIAGISIGLILAVFAVEAFIWFTEYMRFRVNDGAM